jgi:hypothetical protein
MSSTYLHVDSHGLGCACKTVGRPDNAQCEWYPVAWAKAPRDPTIFVIAYAITCSHLTLKQCRMKLKLPKFHAVTMATQMDLADKTELDQIVSFNNTKTTCK